MILKSSKTKTMESFDLMMVLDNRQSLGVYVGVHHTKNRYTGVKGIL